MQVVCGRPNYQLDQRCALTSEHEAEGDDLCIHSSKIADFQPYNDISNYQQQIMNNVSTK